MVDGKEFGIYLTLDEVSLFPEGTTFPLFRHKDNVFAYQLGVHRCPNLINEDGHAACAVHENKPLVCRAFPASVTDDGHFVVLHDKCPSAREGMSYEKGFLAVKEQIEQARQTPQATEMFVLNGKKWVNL